MSERISDMTPAGPLTGAEIVPVVQGGLNRRTTTGAIASGGGGLLYASPTPIVVTDADGELSILDTSVTLPATSARHGFRLTFSGLVEGVASKKGKGDSTIDSITSSGGGEYEIHTTDPNSFVDGQYVTISGTGGGADGTWPIAVIDDHTFDLVGSTYAADSSGGTAASAIGTITFTVYVDAVEAGQGEYLPIGSSTVEGFNMVVLIVTADDTDAVCSGTATGIGGAYVAPVNTTGFDWTGDQPLEVTATATYGASVAIVLGAVEIL